MCWMTDEPRFHCRPAAKYSLILRIQTCSEAFLAAIRSARWKEGTQAGKQS